MPTPQQQQDRLNNWLDALVNETAQDAIADTYEALYPVSYDPSTGVLADAERN